MSDYVYESGMSTRRRKQRRTAITLLLTLLLLFAAFWWAWSYIREDAEDDGDTSATPTGTSAVQCVGSHDPKTITVHVYNSTATAGQARRGADALEQAGFQLIGNVANDPLGNVATDPIELRFGPAGRAYAETFRDVYVPTAVLSEQLREGGGLDVVLGPNFEGFGNIPDLPPCEPEAETSPDDSGSD